MVRAMVISGSILAMTNLISEQTLKGLGFRCLLSFCCRILLEGGYDLDQLEALKMYKWVVRGESTWARQVTTLLPRRINNLTELVTF
ncbi:hypothetical protein Hanom_Chr10g00920261 [Helianthus anomalus]